MDSLAVPNSGVHQDMFPPSFRKQFIIFSTADTVVQGFFMSVYNTDWDSVNLEDIFHVYV